MPKSMTATKVTPRRLVFTLDEAGAVNGLVAYVTVVYDGLTRTETFDLWATLTAQQKQNAQAIYNKLVNGLGDAYLE